MEFETTAAFLTQMIETTQESAENLGTAMKTVIARFTELKENVAGTADSEFDDLDYNKVDKALKTININLKDTNGQFRDLDDVFLELSKRWNTLDRNSQRYIATIAAGSRQQSRFISMMENYERTTELIDVAYDSAGKSSEQFAKYANTIEYKINRLKNSWEQLRISFLNSDTYKGGIDFLNNIVASISNFDAKKVVGLSIIWTTIGKNSIQYLFKGMREGSSLLYNSIPKLIADIQKKVQQKISQNSVVNGISLKITPYLGQLTPLQQELNRIKTEANNIGLRFSGVEEARIQLNQIEQEVQRLKLIDRQLGSQNTHSDGYYRIQAQSNLNMDSKTYGLLQSYIGNQQQQRIIENKAKLQGQAIGQAFAIGLTTAITTYTVTDNPATIFKTTFISVLTTMIPIVVSIFTTMGVGARLAFMASAGPAVIGIGVAIAALAAGIKKLKEIIDKNAKSQAKSNSLYYAAGQEVDRLTKKQEELNKKLEETNAKNETAKTELDNLKTLKKRYEDYTSQIALSVEQKESFLELQQNIAEQYPELISYYDEEGNAIISTIGEAWDTVLEKKKEYYEITSTQQAKQEVANNLNNLQSTNSSLKKEQQYYDILNSGFIQSFKNISNTQFTGYNSRLYWDEATQQYFTDPFKLFNVTENQLSNANLPDILGALSNSDKEVYGNFLSEFFTKNNISTNIKGTGKKFIKNLISELEQDTGETLLKEIQSAIQSETVDMSTTEKELAEQKTALNSSLQKLVGAQLNKTDIFSNSSNNIQTLMTEYMKNQFGLDYEDLEKQFFNAAKDTSYINENWFDSFGNIVTNDLEAVDKAFERFVQEKTNFSDSYVEKQLTGAFSDNVQRILNSFYKKVEEQQLSIVQQIEALSISGVGKNVLSAFVSKNKDVIEKYNERMDFLAKKFGENNVANIDTTTGLISSGGVYQQSYNKLSGVAQNQIYKLAETNVSSSQLRHYLDLLNSGNFSSFSNVLGQIDLTQSYADLLSDKSKYIKLLTEQGISLKEATDTVNKYLQQAAEILNKGFTSKGSASLINEQVNEQVKGFSEGYEDIVSAQKEFMENGELSSETYFKLLEGHFEDYVKTSGKGYELLQKNVNTLITEKALEPYRNVQSMIIQQENLIKHLGSVSSQAFKLFDNGVLRTGTINEYLAKYRELAATGQDTTEMTLLLTDKQKELITLIQDNGCSTFEEYNKILRDNKQALSDIESETYVKGLINITESLSDAQSEAEKLRETLKDSEKTLKENKEALDEAQKSLDEAIHGTENFQSSIDGLINYTRELDKIADSIERIKDALTTVDSAEGATNLLQQLNKEFNNKEITLKAENQAIDKALQNLQATLSSNYGNFVSFNDSGEAIVDFGYTQLDANDELRKAFETEYNLYNEYYDKRKENVKEIEELDKERLEQRKDNLKKYTDIQKDVISILQKLAQEEVSTQKDKYKALEEADNDYLDALQKAIEKQRKLRDQADKYEDLATKQKKLSLMERDTSGANQKDVLSLQKDINKDRTSLLDTEVDNIIDSMKELYEQQKEARNAEIEYMEAATENTQYFADWAANIMSTWDSLEDMQSWYLNNNPDAQDMTVEQTENYLNELKEKYTDFVVWIATDSMDFSKNQEEINNAVNEMYANTKTNIENIGSVTQDIAQIAADKAIEEATKARDDARDKLDETQQKIDETTKSLEVAENIAADKHSSTMKAMVEASESALAEVSSYATKTLAEMLGVDLSNQEEAEQFAIDYGFKTSDGRYMENFRQAVKNAGGDESQFLSTALYKVMGYSGGNNTPSYLVNNLSQSAAEKWLSSNPNMAAHMWVEKQQNSESYGSAKNLENTETTGEHYILWTEDNSKTKYSSKQDAFDAIQRIANGSVNNARDAQLKQWAKNGKYKVYQSGGLVNYTGPAWVDGTPNKPEAFLNSKDTERIGMAAKILSDLPIFNSSNNAASSMTTNVGDTSIEIHINVENVDSDYSVDKMIERVKEDILDVSKPIGTPIILKK